MGPRGVHSWDPLRCYSGQGQSLILNQTEWLTHPSVMLSPCP